MQTGSTGELEAILAQPDGTVAESLARKFVAAHRDDRRGWRALLGCIERNGNAVEAVRVAGLFLAAFPEAPEVVSFVAQLYCNHGHYAAAREILSRPGAPLDEFGTLVRAQLHLLDDPEAAEPLFAGLRARVPLFEAALGIENARSLRAGGRDTRPLGFFLFYDWHRGVQLSVQEAARSRGLRTFMTTSPWLVRALAPDVVVVSDTQGIGSLRQEVPGVRIVHTRHGLADKNYAFAAAGSVDRVCVTSQAIADDYVRHGLLEPERFWITGYPQLDPLLRNLKRGLKAEPRTVLFAPTYTDGLGSGPLLGPDAVRRIRGGDTTVRVIIRPHPAMVHNAPQLLNAWRAAAVGANVEYNDDPATDIGQLMARATVMVSDVSSIALLYLALDRPLVCIDTGATAAGSGYRAPEGLEWRLHTAADVVTPDGLAAAVGAALGDPKRGAAERRVLRRHIFGNLLDGHAGERILDRIVEMRDGG